MNKWFSYFAYYKIELDILMKKNFPVNTMKVTRPRKNFSSNLLMSSSLINLCTRNTIRAVQLPSTCAYEIRLKLFNLTFFTQQILCTEKTIFPFPFILNGI